jgi:hypothetical protein
MTTAPMLISSPPRSSSRPFCTWSRARSVGTRSTAAPSTRPLLTTGRATTMSPDRHGHIAGGSAGSRPASVLERALASSGSRTLTPDREVAITRLSTSTTNTGVL